MSLPTLIDFVLLAAIWGSSFLFMRLAVVDLGPLPTAALRVGISAAFLLPLVLWRGLGPQLRRHWKKIFVIGLLNSGLPFVLFAFAVANITTGLAAILNATVPLFGALVAWLWLSDRPGPGRALGLFIGFAGVTMLAWNGSSFRVEGGAAAPGWAVLASLGATLCYALAASATKKYLAGLSPLVTAAGSHMGATLLLALPAAWMWPATMPGATAWLALLAVGVLCTGVAYVLYFRLIERAGPAPALAVTFVLPVFALLYGVLFLNEKVTAWMLVCAAVILCGTALSTGLLNLPPRKKLGLQR